MQSELATPFLAPVSLLDAPDYYDMIKKPMDFGTLCEIVDSRKCTPVRFEKLVRLIFSNAREYNTEGDEVSAIPPPKKKQ